MRKKTVGLLVAVVVVLAVGAGVLWGGQERFPGESSASLVGTTMKDAMQAFLNGTNVINADDESDAVGSIDGQLISKPYFALRCALTRATGSATPAEDTWEYLKTQIREEAFAREKGIMPADDEFADYSAQQRALINGDEEAKAIFDTFVESLGITEDMYWDYQQRYEAPVVVIRAAVNQYLAAHSEESAPTGEEAEAEILDNEFFESMDAAQ